MRRNILIGLVLMLCLPFLTSAKHKHKEPDSPPAGDMEEDAQLPDSIARLINQAEQLKYQTGTITLVKGVATLVVPKGYKYIDRAGARFILEKVWNNLPDTEVLGMLMTDTADPFTDKSICATLYYDRSGHISDEDAQSTDYDALLEELKADSRNNNRQRAQQHKSELLLQGWAQRPYYDAAAHKLYWAEDLYSPDDSLHTLNYYIKVLGRDGFIGMNIITDMDMLADVNKQLNTLEGSVNYSKDNRYVDYNPSVDNLALLGIGGLVAGKVLAKTGFLALLAKLWYVIVAMLATAAGAVRRFLGVRSKKRKEDRVASLYAARHQDEEEPQN